MRSYVPDNLITENERLARLWIDGEDSFDEVVGQHASKEYKDYYKARIERKKRLREKGIIEN